MTRVQFLFCHKGVQTYLPFPRLIFQANYFCGPNSIPLHERIFKSLCPFNPHLPWERSKRYTMSRSHGVPCALCKSLLLLCLPDYKTCWFRGVLAGALPATLSQEHWGVYDAGFCDAFSFQAQRWHVKTIRRLHNSFTMVALLEQLKPWIITQEWPWSVRSNIGLGTTCLLEFNDNSGGNLVENFTSWIPLLQVLQP